MDFNENKPIYLQIADQILDEIEMGWLKNDQRIPSVREYASKCGVNANTVMRTYTWLQQEDIIYNQRGIGYFVASDANEKVKDMRKREFIDKELPRFIEKIRRYGINISDFLIGLIILMLVPSVNADAQTQIPDSPGGNYQIEIADSLGDLSGDLQEFVLTIKKDIVKSDGSKLTYDMDKDDSSKGQTLLDAIRKVPLITVDGNDNILIKGNSNFKIYVNGKEDPMLSANASRVFKSMPAESVSKIEVITEPGAKYDAEGTGGILNLITEQKQKKDGYTGTLNANTGVSNYGAGIYGRFKYGKVTADARFDYNGNQGLERNQYQSHESIDYNNPVLHKMNMVNNQVFYYNYYGGGLNLSWEPNAKHLFSLGADITDVNAIIKRFDGSTTMSNQFGESVYAYRQHLSGKMLNFGVNSNAGYKYNFNDSGNSLILGYRFSFSDDSMNLIGHYYDLTDIQMAPYTENNNDNYLREHTATIDYSLPLKNNKYLFETGAKGIFRRNSANTFSQNTDEFNNILTLENSLSRQVQDIYAIYASFMATMGKINAKAGVRYEHTYMGLDSSTQSIEKYYRNLNDIVPNAALTYSFGPAQNLRLGYQMRITRPSISQLNPAQFKLTESYIQVGNPYLESEHYHNLTLTYSNYGSSIGGNVSFDYFRSDNTIEDYDYYNNGIGYQTYENIGHTQTCGINGFLNWNINAKMSLSMNGAVSYKIIKADNELKNNGWEGNFGINYSYTGPYEIKYSAYGGYSSRTINLQGSWGGWHYYGLSINKGFLKEKSLNLTLNAGNFFTRYSYWHSKSKTPDFTSKNLNRRENWNVSLSISWNFGKLNDRVKTTGGDLENNDTKQSNGKSSGIGL